MRVLIKFVDENYKRPTYCDIFRAFPPILMLILFLGIYVSLAVAFLIYSPFAQWAPFLVSMVAILIAYYSFIMGSRKYANRRLAYNIANRLSAFLPDKSNEALCLLPTLVAIKMENNALKLQQLYDVDKELFNTYKLMENYYLT